MQPQIFACAIEAPTLYGDVRHMTLPPRWKVKRELWRVRDQVARGLVGTLYDRPRMVIHRRRFDRNIRIEHGMLADSRKTAVVVLYQPKGIARSTFFMLDHIVAQGYAPIVVSNASLSLAEYEAIRRRSVTILNRPNAGYDFGAYRDAIAFLQREGAAPDRLVLMNDSTWFPLREEDDSLARMEASGADLTGHVFKTESAEKKGRDHVESHLLMLSPGFLGSSEFASFWDRYVMSDTRELTVLRGEKAFSQLAMTSLRRVEALLSREKLLEALGGLDDASLLGALKDTVHHRAQDEAHCASLIEAAEAGRPWRDGFLRWVDQELRSSRQHLASSTFVAPAMKLGLLSFVKKSDDRRHHLARQKVLAMARSGAIPALHPDVSAEIAAAVADWTPPFDWRAPPAP